jgi:glutamate/aspartate transport system permease protein
MSYDFDWSSIPGAIPFLIQGMGLTLTLLVLAMTGGIIFGTLLALMRLSSMVWLSSLAGAYVNLFRSVPLVLVIFWFYFLVPFMLKAMTGDQTITVGPFYSALIAFMIFEAAYYCEIIRAGIQSIPRGQVSAAYALGMTYGQAMRYVILPQAFRNMIPLLLTQSIILFQDTSLVYVISLADFLGVASKVGQRDGRLVEMYLFAAVVYLVMSYSASWLVMRLQKRFAV